MADAIFTAQIKMDMGGYKDLVNAADASERLESRIRGIESAAASMAPVFGNFTQQIRHDLEETTSIMDEAKKEYTSSSSNDYSNTLNAGRYEVGLHTIAGLSKDLTVASQLARSLSSLGLTNHDISVVNQQLPKLRDIILKVANDFSHNTSTHSGIVTDDVIRGAVMHRKDYQDIASQIKTDMTYFTRKASKNLANNKTFDNFMSDLIGLNIITEVDKTQRGSFMNHLRGQNQRMGPMNSFADMLPGQFKAGASNVGFAEIQQSDYMTRTSKNNNDRLSKNELKRVASLVRENQYAAKAFEQAQVLRRENGYFYLDKAITRQQVNAAAALIHDMTINGAKGLPMYGISDVADPNMFDRILNKTNKMLYGGLDAERFLTKQFSWLSPGRFTDTQLTDLRDIATSSYLASMPKPKNGKATKTPKLNKNIGHVNFAVQPNTYQATTYTIDELLRGENFQDNSVGANREHKIPVNQSLELDAIMREETGGHQVLPHNSALNNVVYVSIDPRLADPNTPDDIRKDLEKKYGNLFLHGRTINGVKYAATRINPKSTGIEMIPLELKNRIESKYGKDFFTGGMQGGKFTNVKDFAGYFEYMNKIATEGVDIRDLFGTNLSNLKVVVMDIEEDTKGQGGVGPGLNGASFLSSKLTGGTAFQGRILGVKSALNSVNMKQMVDLFGGKIPVRAPDGSIQFIEADTDVVLNKADLKGFGIAFQKDVTGPDGKTYKVTKSSDELSKEFANRIRTSGIYVNKTAAQAGSKTLSWIPSQLAQLMSIDATQAQVFSDAFWNLYTDLNTPLGQIKHVFADDSNLQKMLIDNPTLLNQKQYKNRVEAFRRNMLERVGRGDLVVPEELGTHRGLAAPWVANVFSDAINALYQDIEPTKGGMYRRRIEGSEIPTSMLGLGYKWDPNAVANIKDKNGVERQVKGAVVNAAGRIVNSLIDPKNGSEISDVRIADNAAVYSKSLSDMLGISRFPASIGSLQQVNNVANQQALIRAGKSKSFKDLTKLLGLDPNAIYFSQSSPLLDLLQSEDFDGDVNEIFDLISSNAPMSKIIQTIFSKTIKTHNDLMRKGQMTEEEKSQREAALKQNIMGDLTEFNTKDPAHIGKWISAYAQQSFRLGAPNAITRNALQIPINRETAKAINMASSQYDANSVAAKYGFFFNSTKEGQEIMNKYKSWSEFYNTLMKSKDDRGHYDYNKFRDTNLFKINAPTRTMTGNIYSSLTSRMIARSHGQNIDKEIDWDKAFENSFIGIMDSLESSGVLGDKPKLTKETRKYIKGMQTYLSGLLKSDFLIGSSDDIFSLLEMKEAARKAEGNIGRTASDVDKIIEAFGGATLANIIDPNIGLYEGNVSGKSKDWGARLVALERFGINPYSNLDLKSLKVYNKDNFSEWRSEKNDDDKLRTLARMPKETIQEQLDNTLWSITNILGFADETFGGSRWIKQNLGKPEHSDTGTSRDTAFGHATEDIIQEYWTRRQELVDKNVKEGKGRTLTDAQTTDLINELVHGKNESGQILTSGYAGFNEYIRKQLEEDSLSSEYENIIKEYTGQAYVNRTNRKYHNVRDFLTSENGLRALFPTDIYDYLGHEHILTMSNVGKKILGGEDIHFTGREDALFRNIQNHKLTIADIKTYGGWDTLTNEQLKKVEVQLMAYAMADQFQNGGSPAAVMGDGSTLDTTNNNFEALKAIFPDVISGTGSYTHDFSVDPKALKLNMDNIKLAVQTMQELANTGLRGDFIYSAQNMVHDILIGKDKSLALRNYKWDNEIHDALTAGSINATGIGATLTAHEDYKETMKDVTKMTGTLDKMFLSDDKPYGNIWEAYHQTILAAERQQEVLEANKQYAESKNLGNAIEKAKDKYNQTLPTAAIKSYNELADSLERVNKGFVASKEIDNVIEEWDSLSKSVDQADKNYAEIGLKIKAIQDEWKTLDDKQKDRNNQHRAKTKEEQEKEQTEIDTFNANSNIQRERLKQQQKELIEAQKATRDPYNRAAVEVATYKNRLETRMLETLADSYNIAENEMNGKVSPNMKKLTIKQMMDAFEQDINQNIGNVSELSKKGIIQPVDASVIISRFENLKSEDNLNKLRKRYINDTLLAESTATKDILGTTSISDNVQAEVLKKRLEIEQQKADLTRIFAREKLSEKQQTTLNGLMDSLHAFDFDEYESGLKVKAVEAYANSLLTRKDAVIQKQEDRRITHSKYMDFLKQAIDPELEWQREADEAGFKSRNPEMYKLMQIRDRLQMADLDKLDRMDQLELDRYDINQLQNMHNLFSSITGMPIANATMNDLKARSYANAINTFINQNGIDALPAEFLPFVNPDNTANQGAIADTLKSTLDKSQKEKQELDLVRQQTQAMQYQNQLEQNMARYKMSNTYYGSDIIGRSLQYNEQQYNYWKNNSSNYEAQLNTEEATRDALLLRKDDLEHSYYGKTKDSIYTESMNNIDKQLDASNSKIKELQNNLEFAQKAMKNFGSAGGFVGTSLMNVSRAVDGLIMRLGRRLFMKIANEITSFVKQFNADMITIQQITGKSDEEMGIVRSSSLSQAKSLHTSVKNVTQTKAALYRQGLSDAEVEDRTEAIIKFSTVTGQNITNATKGLTTAIQTGLVSSVEEAMDVLVALGDSAATTAEEIQKGMQKAAASAKTAGVSYAELTSMLTIATSKTQLSGNQAGTFFQTLFSRMNRVTKEGYLTDEGGETTNINDVEAALKTAGISLRDGKDSFRSSFDVLRDVAKVWNGLNDLQKNNITYAMVGNRNANMFNTLMEGMGEDGGALLDEYLGLTENAKGTTQSKYEVSIKGIQAALDTLKSTFDEFIASLGSSNEITSIFDNITKMIQGLTDLNNAGKQTIAIAETIMSLLTGVFIKSITTIGLAATPLAPIAGIIGSLFGIASSGFLFNILPGLSGGTKTPNNDTNSDAREKLKFNNEQYKQKYESVDKAISSIEKITEKYDSLSEISSEHSLELANSVLSLSAVFPKLGRSIDITNASLEDYITLYKEAKEAMKEQKKDDLIYALGIAKPIIEEESSKAKETISNSLAGKTSKEVLPVTVNSTVQDIEKWRKKLQDEGYDPNDFDYRYYDESAASKLTGILSGTRITPSDALKELLTMYLANDISRPYDAWHSYRTADEVINHLNADGQKQEDYYAAQHFIDQVYDNDSYLNKFYYTSDLTRKDRIKQYVKDVITNGYSDSWTTLTSGNTDVESALLDYYYSKYPEEDLLNPDNIFKFLEEIINSGFDYSKFIDPTSRGFIYSIGGENGIGLNDLSDKSIFDAIHSYIISGGYAKNGSWLDKYIKEDKTIDYNAFRKDIINNITGLKEHSPISAVSKSISQTSKNKGFIEEYRKLYSLLDVSNINDFLSLTDIEVPNLSSLLQNDAELDKIIDSLRAEDGIYSAADLGEYLLKKSLNSQNLTDYFSAASSTLQTMADQSKILATGKDNLTPEMKATLAKAFSTSVANVEQNLDFFYSVFENAVESNIDSFTSSMADTIVGIMDAADPTKKLNINDIAATNPLLQQLLNFSATHGVYWSSASSDWEAGDTIEGVVMDSPGTRRTVSSSGSWTLPTDNPLVATESIFTNAYIAQQAQALLNSTDWKTMSENMDDTLEEQIKSAYPELYKYLNMTDEQRASPEGQGLLHDFEVKVKVSGYDDLVKLGKLTSDIASNLKEIAELDVGSDAASRVNAIAGSLTTTAMGINAFNAIIGGSHSDSNYNALANYLNVDASTIMGMSNTELMKTYGSSVAADKNKLVNMIPIIMASLPPEYREGFISQLQKYGIKVQQSEAAKLLGLDNDYSVSFIPGVNPTAAQVSQRVANTYDPRRDAMQLLKFMNSGMSYQDAISKGVLANSDLARTLAEDEAFQTLVKNGDRQGILNTIAQYAYGMDAYNSYTAYGNEDVMKFMTALANGDTDTLRTFDSSNSGLAAALGNYGTWGKYAARVMAGGTLNPGEINEINEELRQAQVTQKLLENPELNADLLNQYGSLFGTSKQRNSTVNQIVDDVVAFSEAYKELGNMTKYGTYDSEKIKEYAKQFGDMSDMDVDSLDASADSVNKVRESMRTSYSGYATTLDEMATMIKTSGMDGAADIAETFRTLANAITQGANLVTDAWTESDFASFVNNSSGYGAKQLQNSRVNTLLEMATSAGDAQSLLNALTSSETDWIKNGSQFQSFLEGSGLAEAFARLYTYDQNTQSWQLTGDPNTYNMLLNDLYNNSSMAGLRSDQTAGIMMGALNGYAGGDFAGALSTGSLDLAGFSSYLSDNTWLVDMIKQFDGGTEALAALNDENRDSAKTFRDLKKVVDTANTTMGKYGYNTESVKKNLQGLNGSQQDVNQTLNNMNKELLEANERQWARQQWRKGNRSEDVVSSIMQQTGINNKKFVKDSANAGLVEQLLKGVESSDIEVATGFAQTATAAINDVLNTIDFGTIELDNPLHIMLNGGSVEDVGIGSIISALQGQVSDDVMSILQTLQAYIEANWDIVKNSEGQYVAELKSDSVKFGGGGGGIKPAGGGGGGGKSAADKLLQNLKNKITLADHRIKMTQLQETKYEQLGQLGNVNNMIEYENELQREKSVVLADAITKLREQLAATERGSDDWQKLYEQVLQYEEQLDETNNTIDANTKKMKQNEQAILKTHTDLEDLVDQEIRNRIQIQRDMLDARVQMETTVLDAIKQRYQDEWDYTVPTNRIAGTPQSPPATAQLARANANARKWRGCTRAISSQASHKTLQSPLRRRFNDYPIWSRQRPVIAAEAVGVLRFAAHTRYSLNSHESVRVIQCHLRQVVAFKVVST